MRRDRGARSLATVVLVAAVASVVGTGAVYALLGNDDDPAQLNSRPEQACVDAGGRMCNSSGDPEDPKLNPFREPAAVDPAYLPRSRVVASLQVVVPEATSANSAAVLTTRDEFEQRTGIASTAAANPDRKVWVATVYAPTLTEGSPAVPPKRVLSYSAVIDAESGQVTDDCKGCDWAKMLGALPGT